MAACTMALTAMLAFLLIRGWSMLDDEALRWKLVAGALAALTGTGVLLWIVISGNSPFPMRQPKESIERLLWAAALGDPQASTSLQAAREGIRTILRSGHRCTPEQWRSLRALYSVALSAGERILADLRETQVFLSHGSPADKIAVIRRLENEITIWRADYRWFEQVIEGQDS